MSLLAYCSVVSNRGLLGTVFSSLRRIHETAVSCNRISCMCPGYTLALSPISTLARDLEASRGPLEASLDAGLEARSVSNNTMRAMWHSDLEASRGPLEAGVEAGLEARSVSNNTMRAMRRSDLEASRGPLEAGLEAGLEARSVSNNTMRAMWHNDLEASRGPLEAGLEAGLEARSVSNNTMRATSRPSRGPRGLWAL